MAIIDLGEMKNKTHKYYLESNEYFENSFFKGKKLEKIIKYLTVEQKIELSSFLRKAERNVIVSGDNYRKSNIEIIKFNLENNG